MPSSLIGVDAMRAKLLGLGAAVQPAIARALYQEGETIIAQSKERVPIDTGALKSSGFVHAPVHEGTTTRVTVGFGGAAQLYAAIVHEDLRARHVVGGPKFLESVLNEHAAGFAERMGARIAADLQL